MSNELSRSSAQSGKEKGWVRDEHCQAHECSSAEQLSGASCERQKPAVVVKLFEPAATPATQTIERAEQKIRRGTALRPAAFSFARGGPWRGDDDKGVERGRGVLIGEMRKGPVDGRHIGQHKL